MRTPLGQYLHLAAIILFVVGPAWGFHPILGVVTAYVSLLAWALLSPFTAFDVALGNTVIRLSRVMWASLPLSDQTNTGRDRT